MMFKKMITFISGLLAVTLLAVPAFAAVNQASAVDRSRVSISNEANNDLLNAHTESSPVNGTRVTTWDNTGHATQRWDYTESVPGKQQQYWLRNSANTNYAITCYGVDGQQATLQLFTRNMDTQAVKFIYEGGSSVNVYGLANPTYALALTTTGSYNGAPVLWKSSNGLNNQLWVLGMYA